MRLKRASMVFAAEALALPTGIITVIFLLRQLGAADYGAYAVALVPSAWAQVVIAAVLGRPAQAFIARSGDWRSAAADTTVLHAMAGIVAALVLAGAAPFAGRALGGGGIGLLIALAALDVAVISAAHGYRMTAMATERYGVRALMAGARWVLRLVLIIGFVLAGWGAAGAILGGVLSSVAELAIGYLAFRLPRPRMALKGFWSAAAPVSLGSLSFRLFEKVDLILVQAITGAVTAGLYGAAQNVTIVATLFGMSYAGALVTEAGKGQADPARLAAAAHTALRMCLWIAPAALFGAWMAPLLVEIAFGPDFAGAAPLVAVLAGAALFMTWSVFATSMLTGAGRGRLVLLTAGPALPLAVAGHLFVIPYYGAPGGAVCTLAVALLSALASWTAVFAELRPRIPWVSLASCGAACVALAGAWLLAA